MKTPARLAIVLSFSLILGGTASFSWLQATAAGPFTTTEVLAHLQTKAQELKSLSARFQQLKYSRLLVTPLESEGNLYWQPPARLHWEVVGPAPLTLVVQDDMILVLYPDLKKANLYRKPLGGGLLERITGATGDPEAFQRQYRVQVAPLPRPGGEIWVQMTMEPKSRRRARYFKRLEVKIDPSTWLPQEIAILESNKDWTVIYLSNLRENTKLPDGLFRVEPPEGFQVEKFQGRGRP